MSFEEFRRLVAQHAPGGISATAIPGVLVSRMDDGGSPDESTTGTVLAIVAQGTKRLSVGGSVHDYGVGQYLVASVDLPVSGQFTDATPRHPALGLGLELRPEVIAELMLSSAADFHRAARGESRHRRSRWGRCRHDCSTRRSVCCDSSTTPVTSRCSPR